MKIKSVFVLQQIVDEYIVVPVGDAASILHGVVKLNETGAFLWKLLSERDLTEEQLVNALCKEYKVEKSKALIDVNSFIKQLKEMGCIY